MTYKNKNINNKSINEWNKVNNHNNTKVKCKRKIYEDNFNRTKSNQDAEENRTGHRVTQLKSLKAKFNRTEATERKATTGRREWCGFTRCDTVCTIITLHYWFWVSLQLWPCTCTLRYTWLDSCKQAVVECRVRFKQ